MGFWKKFKQLVPLRHIVFILCLFAATITIQLIDSADDVQITIGESAVDIVSDKYKMNIPYEMIETLELMDIVDGGTKISGSDNMVMRYGTWENDTWGTYCICADLDATSCIVAHLNDGQIFVFSQKNNEVTESVYNQILTYLEK